MHKIVRHSKICAACVALLLLGAARGQVAAQPLLQNLTAKSASSEDDNQYDMLKSYLQVKSQLRATELAIASYRQEADEAARLQTAAIAEKLNALKLDLAAERERQKAEADRAQYQRELQRADDQETNRIVLWVAAAFGGVGLLTMLFSTVFQWRAINRIAEIATMGPPGSGAHLGLLATGQNGFGGDAVALSNQRFMAVIDRMEQRILELEHTAAQPMPGAAPETPGVADLPQSVTTGTDPTAQITALLGRGRSLLEANQAEEAVACYDEILLLVPDHPDALVKKGSALERLRQDQEAIVCYDRAIKADRKMTLAYLSKGGIYNRLQRHEEALACYEQALQVEVKESKEAVAT